jgi:phage tail tape-measure protein
MKDVQSPEPSSPQKRPSSLKERIDANRGAGYGAMIGAVAGAIIAGPMAPVGAIIGGAIGGGIGSIVDKKFRSNKPQKDA